MTNIADAKSRSAYNNTTPTRGSNAPQKGIDTMNNYWTPQVTIIDEKGTFADFDMQFNGASHEITEDTAYALHIALGKALEELTEKRAWDAEVKAEELEYNRLNRLTVHNSTVKNVHEAHKQTKDE